MASDIEEKILQVLQEQPNLIVEQIARAINAKPNSVAKRLKLLEQRKLISPYPIPSLKMSGRLYTYRRTDLKSDLLKGNFKHSLKVFDVYAALRSTGIPMEWIPKVALPQLGKDRKGKFIFPDGGVYAFGKKFYIEEETGSHELIDIENKVSNYIQRGERCFVIFVVNDYQPNLLEPIKKTAKDFGFEILGMLEEKGRRNQFTVTPHNVFIENPLASILVSPTAESFSLETIE